MISFSVELEDVCFTATRPPDEGAWGVHLFESEQAQKDFPRDEPLTHDLILNDEEMAALLYLAANGDAGTLSEACYEVIDPKLVGVPYDLRPIP